MFVDEVKIYARAGHGGKGCVAFLRETFRPKGGPCGGNGGRGGDVILVADHDLNNLVDRYYQPRLIAEKGEGGLGKGMDGRAGKDLRIKVPCGTMVWRLPQTALPELAEESPPDSDERPVITTSASRRPVLRSSGSHKALEVDLTEESEETGVRDETKGELVADLTQHGQEFVLCQGGRGGLGNRNFATATRQAPRFAQPGEPGDEGNFLLELRMIADIGLVGYPNAGKSTLLSAISRARPKIAPYPFTTLRPQVGMVDYPDHVRLTVCDVPGLIEGAHQNIGLGHAFLRHIQRCKVLVILIDVAATDGRDPVEDYRLLLRELELYDASLLARPRLIAANKIDEPEAEKHLRRLRRRVRGVPIVSLSAAFGEGVDRFIALMRTTAEAASRGEDVQ